MPNALLPILSRMDLTKFVYNAGDEIITQGRTGTQAFVLNRGAVGIFVNGSQVAELNEPGLIVGEISALLGRPHTASVQAMEFCEFFILEDLPKLARDNPDITMALLETMADRLVRMNDELVETRNSPRSDKETRPWWRVW